MEGGGGGGEGSGDGRGGEGVKERVGREGEGSGGQEGGAGEGKGGEGWEEEIGGGEDIKEGADDEEEEEEREEDCHGREREKAEEVRDDGGDGAERGGAGRELDRGGGITVVEDSDSWFTRPERARLGTPPVRGVAPLRVVDKKGKAAAMPSCLGKALHWGDGSSSDPSGNLGCWDGHSVSSVTAGALSTWASVAPLCPLRSSCPGLPVPPLFLGWVWVGVFPSPPLWLPGGGSVGGLGNIEEEEGERRRKKKEGRRRSKGERGKEEERKKGRERERGREGER